eukprot:22693-Pyramimonas_sp.AAC.1
MSYRAVRHSNKNTTIRRASLRNLDVSTGYAARAVSLKLFVLCYCLGDDDEFLEMNRAADKLPRC